jgi:hypothetical protein
MLKRWFENSSNGNGASGPEQHRNGSAAQAVALLEPKEEAVEVPTNPDFDRIYRSATVKPPQLAYGIMKVVGMMNSGYLSSLTPEARRSAVMMALEAMGAAAEDLLHDAVVRERALKESEDQQQERLRALEAKKLDENQKLQAELERLTADYMSRMQANLDQLAREQDEFRAWQRKKGQQAQQIAEAAALCVPEGSAHTRGVATVLERACGTRF